MTQSNWPTKDILWFGYFGAGTPAGARYRNRILTALLLLLVSVVALIPAPSLRPFAVALPGLAFAFICREWWRYIESLDELARRLQMEAAAFTYILGVCVMMALAGFGLLNIHINCVFAFILLEPIRAWRLLVLARRYE